MGVEGGVGEWGLAQGGDEEEEEVEGAAMSTSVRTPPSQTHPLPVNCMLVPGQAGVGQVASTYGRPAWQTDSD